MLWEIRLEVVSKLHKKVALITGSNKGLGFEISRQLGEKEITVVMGARDPAKGQAAADRLKAEGIDAHFIVLDVTDSASINALPTFLEEKFGGLDILVNNAGIASDDRNTPPSRLETKTLRRTFETNFFGAFEVARALIPLIRRSRAGRIVNMSSTLGSLTDVSNAKSPYDAVMVPAYQASKTALNALTALFAKELRDTAVKVNSACPGWVRTDMGSDAAPMSVVEGADTPVWLATLPADGPTGGFFNSRQPIEW